MDIGAKREQKAFPMRFPSLLPQSEIDQTLRCSKSRQARAAPLPWGSALFGVMLFFLMQALL